MNTTFGQDPIATKPRQDERDSDTVQFTSIPAKSGRVGTDNMPKTSILARDRLLKLKPSTVLTKKAFETNQETCHFFKLPPEMRSEIYALVLGGLYIRICEYRLSHLHVWTVFDSNRLGYMSETLTGSNITPTTRGIRPPWCHKSKSRSNLTLPARTCRQMYAETALLHYELNVFSFQRVDVLRKWMDQLKPVQKRALRRLDLSEMPRIGVTLGKHLTGLQWVFRKGEWREGLEQEMVRRWITTQDQKREMVAESYGDPSG